MESIRLPYKNDRYSNPIFARVSWATEIPGPRPIVIIYHGGGIIVGSSEIVPMSQINYLASKGFVVVIPNYRLAPQITAKDAFADCEEAFDWATHDLVNMMTTKYDIELESSRVGVMGHSSGGTIALHLAACKNVKAVTAFYPSLFNADTSTSAHQPISAPPFGMAPDYHPSDEDWESITPQGKQVSEASFALPGATPLPRNKWQIHLVKHGQWMSTILPDGDYAAIDPMTRLTEDWPPVMIVQGDLDTVGGSSLELAQRAEREMKDAGLKAVQLEVVPNESHMFDLPSTVGTSDLGPKWQAVVKGLDWLQSYV